LYILALDTTSRAGSLAVAHEGTILSRGSGDPARTHGERLPEDIMRALDEAGIGVDALTRLAVAAGPGSFTGLRVGIAAIQGLAVARQLPVVPVPTLEAIARAVASAGRQSLVAAWMDGQRGEVFAALYESGGVREVHPAMAAKPEKVLDAWRLPAHSPILFAGDGAIRYRAIVEARLRSDATIVEPPPLAPTIAQIACAEPDRAVPPHEIVPVYVRRPDAELARAQRQREVDDRAARTNNLRLERATSARDLDDVAALEAACFTNPWTREMLEQEIQQSGVARVYVARDETGALAAFCTCWLIVDELHINTIAVDPARRRTGAATRLMRQVMEEAAREGATRATLEVRASNDAARRLYAHLGFVESGVRSRYYSQPVEDAIILWRDLPSS
jgi:tRNA threonylcarbamoyladenosine biosynthesis protein TsaB